MVAESLFILLLLKNGDVVGHYKTPFDSMQECLDTGIKFVEKRKTHHFRCVRIERSPKAVKGAM